MEILELGQKARFEAKEIPLPSSKSESNRVLIIDALTEGQKSNS
jgi:hypothetical protein